VTTTMSESAAPATKGRVMHSSARYYDLMVWLLTLGRERAFRERLIDLARLQTGESVLDVGCGTGTLAIAAKRRVGPTGVVHAIDASPEMTARARRKATKQGVNVDFRTAIVEALPFPDGRFDVVLSTLMLHHLPRPTREQCAREIRRVLKPEGRVLAVDFGMPAGHRKGLLGHLHRRGHVAAGDVIELLSAAGLHVADSGLVGFRNLHFALATAPGGT
jgi:ubiquinone/menaquinone biosynthesis C-methylase UbiE